MEHAPTIGALCGGRFAKTKGVRYVVPSASATPRAEWVLKTVLTRSVQVDGSRGLEASVPL